VDEITPEFVKSIPIPLPPPSVQESIGRLITEAEERRKEAQAEVRAARAALMGPLFERRGARPASRPLLTKPA
jgi:restriction endonuclease S subunit